MDMNFLGMFVTAGITVVGFYITVYRHQKAEWQETVEQRQQQIESTHKLTEEIVKLGLTISHLSGDLVKQTDRVSKHGKEIDAIRKNVQENTSDIKHLKEQLQDHKNEKH